MSVQRRYMLKKLSAGDWVLPGNGLCYAYRIRRHDGRFWEVSACRWSDYEQAVMSSNGERSNVALFAPWEAVESFISTRGEAVRRALEWEGGGGSLLLVSERDEAR